MVVFPRMVTPILVGRPGSLWALDEALSSNLPLLLCAQKSGAVEEPHPSDLYRVGVIVSVIQTVRVPDGVTKVVVEGIHRAKVSQMRETDGCLRAAIEIIPDEEDASLETTGLMRVCGGLFAEYARLTQRISPDVAASLGELSDGHALADTIGAYISVGVEDRQKLLEFPAVQARLQYAIELLTRENDLLTLETKVRDRVREQMERGQRDYYLNEQIKAIQQELGSRGDVFDDESDSLRKRIEAAEMPQEAKDKALTELERYERVPPMSPESGILLTYIEWLTDVPWNKRTPDEVVIDEAQKVLDKDHYGLEKVKERILEFLAVRQLRKSSAKGPILCFVGPPGVGKTSLGQSIARAMGRKFVRVSLGGVRDEAEIRGHRRTYVGALPGRIIQSMKKSGTRNPVFMLDEIDKMTMDFRGDPSAALLEVLDPEQNTNFNDHYLEVDFDLSEVLFITTANNEFDIPPALIDRMELVRIPGYTLFEKLAIARKYLVPRQIAENGLKRTLLSVDEGAIRTIIERYTREAGVRELERRLGAICRKVARKVVGEKPPVKRKITSAEVLTLLGPPEYSEPRSEAAPLPGVAIGMAWTPTGGDILNIETSIMKGKGLLTLTGQLGEVMRESAQAAYTYIRAHAESLGLAQDFHRTRDTHIHVPEGAIPKDGPSAGSALAVSLLSALKEVAPAPALSMTGELTLRGRILPVGGIKEKVLAAHRAGIRTVLLPRENEKDLVDIPAEVKSDIRFILVSNIDEVFANAFPKPVGKDMKK